MKVNEKWINVSDESKKIIGKWMSEWKVKKWKSKWKINH